MHHIRKHILRVLTYAKYAKFSEMRPPNVDSNAYSYHLKMLQKDGFVEKTTKGYRLSPYGLGYVDRVNTEKFEQRLQPKIITMLVSQNEKGEVLLWAKKKQPFIGAWSLPNGKMHITDTSIMAAAEREASEKLQAPPLAMQHVGACYIRAHVGGELISYVLAHIFIVKLAEPHVLHENTAWYSKLARQDLKLLPATEQIIERTASATQFFFEEYEEHWRGSTIQPQSVTIATDEII